MQAQVRCQIFVTLLAALYLKGLDRVVHLEGKPLQGLQAAPWLPLVLQNGLCMPLHTLYGIRQAYSGFELYMLQ